MLGRRDDDVLPALLNRLDDSDFYTRCGVESVGCLGPRADAAGLDWGLFNDPDPTLEILACNAIANLGPEARQAS